MEKQAIGLKGQNRRTKNQDNVFRAFERDITSFERDRDNRR